MQNSARAEEPEYEGLDHSRYKKFWEEWASGYAEPREQHLWDQRCFDGDVKGTGWGQWTEEDLGELKKRRQPPTIRNVIIRKVNSICGVEQRGRSEPRALPRNPQDQKSAEIATDALRFVKERSGLNQIKADALLDALTIGYAAVEIGGAENHVPHKNIAWKDFFFDPRSRAWDFSDARFYGVAKWVDKDVALATYAPEVPEPELPPQPIPTGDPVLDEQALAQWEAAAMQVLAAYEDAKKRQQRAADAIENTMAGATPSGGESFEDVPTSCFSDRTRQRVFIVDMWHRDPKKGWFRCVFTGTDKLFTEAASLKEPDDRGKLQTVPPIKAFSLYVSSDGWRFGEVRNMRPVQVDLNKRLSKSLHRLATSRVIMDEGAVADGNIEAVRQEAARPDALIKKVRGAELRVEDGAALSAADMALAQEARQYLEAHGGANEQLQGEKGGATSGRMFLAMQQAGMGALATVFNRFFAFEDAIYRADWARIKQFWTAPMYVRVTDDKNAARFAAVNGAPVVNDDNGATPGAGLGHNGGPAGDPLAPSMPGENLYGGPAGGAMGAALTMPPMGMPPGAPHVPGMPQPQAEPEKGPMLSEIDVDIILDRAPEAATLQAEQFEALMQLAAVYAQAGKPIPLKMLIMASALTNKSELLDALEAEENQPNPQAEIAKEAAAADIKHKRAQTANLKADAVTKVGKMKLDKRRLDLDARKFESERRTDAAQLYADQMSQADAELEQIYAELGLAPAGAAQNSPAPIPQ